MMTINWQEFTPFTSFIGGILIGIGAIILMLFKGRIAGISGIIGALMQFKNTPKDHYIWRILFLLGMISSTLIYSLIFNLPEIKIQADTPLLLISGLLVGFGTRMGSGCTSGHGVCGLGRLSPRSFVATLSFMTSGFLMTYILLHWSK